LARLKVPVRRPQQLAWAITGPLFLAAFLLTIPVVAHSKRPFGNVTLGLVLLAMFAFADATQLRFEVRRQGYTMSLAEIPMLLALFYLPPLTVLGARVLAAAAVQAVVRWGLVKACFNLSVLSAGTALANLIVFLWRPAHDAGPATWIVLVVAVMANVALTAVAVGGVITLVQGWTSMRQLTNAFVLSLAVAAATITVGLIMLLALQSSGWAVPLLVGIATVLGVAYRAYAQFLSQHKSLTELYGLTRAMTDTGYDGTLPDVLLGRTRELLGAESATLWLPAQARHPEVLLSARVDYPGLLDSAASPEQLRRQAMETGETIAVSPKLGTDRLRSLLHDHGVKDIIVVPLRSGTATIGTLEVAGRLLDRKYFDSEDVRLLETLAAHAGVAVENSRLVDRLRFDANHDALTGLPNRRRLLAAIEESVAVVTPGEVVAILLYDVVGLRDVNDTLGHGAGDQVLAEVARRLRGLAPPAALVARVGGDEFAVTLRTPSSDTALALAEEIRTALQDPMVLGTLTVDIDTTVGVAVHPDHGGDPATLLQRADVATHAAKSVSSATQLFNPGLESRSVRRLGLAGDLRRALDAGEIEVYFQPKLALSGRRVVGVECLARWDHPVHGSVSPEDFVAVAEHTGQVARLTETVLREGLRRAREWTETGRPLSVAVNVSPRTLIDPTFSGLVGQLLEEYAVAPERLTLEITEVGIVGDPSRPLPTLRRLRDLGVRLAVDDFGSGYSSLAYLRRLPVHEVKVDRAFVQGMATDPGDLAIVRAIVDLSRHFGLSVVAEGVESELTLGRLDEIGCDFGQGFLFSRPLPYERLEAWLYAQTEAESTPAGEVRRLRAVP
jgi:diguanylate cyclase (GGDEF)-like protein